MNGEGGILALASNEASSVEIDEESISYSKYGSAG